MYFLNLVLQTEKKNNASGASAVSKIVRDVSKGLQKNVHISSVDKIDMWHFPYVDKNREFLSLLI